VCELVPGGSKNPLRVLRDMRRNDAPPPERQSLLSSQCDRCPVSVKILPADPSMPPDHRERKLASVAQVDDVLA
jgi:hypothetical protein